MSDLSSLSCVPCRGGVPPLDESEQMKLLKELDGAWQIVDGHHLLRDFSYPDFAKALDYVNRVGAMAEDQGHHPDIYLAWGKVQLTIWTHKIDGLTESDFIFAAKCDNLV